MTARGWCFVLLCAVMGSFNNGDCVKTTLSDLCEAEPKYSQFNFSQQSIVFVVHNIAGFYPSSKMLEKCPLERQNFHIRRLKLHVILSWSVLIVLATLDMDRRRMRLNEYFFPKLPRTFGIPFVSLKRGVKWLIAKISIRQKKSQKMLETRCLSWCNLLTEDCQNTNA